MSRNSSDDENIAPEEYEWNVEIIRRIVNSTGNGWDSNTYADGQIQMILNKEGDMSKWNDKEGFPRYEKYLRQLDIIVEGGREYAMEKEGHINATLGGALGG